MLVPLLLILVILALAGGVWISHWVWIALVIIALVWLFAPGGYYAGRRGRGGPPVV